MLIDKSQRHVLFFIAGSSPTEADVKAKNKIHNAVFRNGDPIHHADNEGLEKCVGVAGPAIPPAYRAAFKVVDAEQPELPNQGDGAVDPTPPPPPKPNHLFQKKQ